MTTSDNREKVAAEFREEIKHAFEPEARVLSADRELRYCLELQRERIGKRNLKYTEEMIHGGMFPNGLNRVRAWKDGHYDVSWTVDFITHNKTIQRDGMKTYRMRDYQSIYETVVDVHAGEDVSKDPYCCPNCGSVSTVKELQEGCAYCGTHFRMDELYPKVKNYFFVSDMRSENLLKTVLKFGLYMLPVDIIISFLTFFNTYSETQRTLSTYILLPFVILVMMPVCGFMGLLLACFFKAFVLLPSLFEVIGSRNRFASAMSAICPEFILDHFAAKMVTLFKIFAFSDDRTDLPFYSGTDTGKDFDNLINIDFSGDMACKSVAVKDNTVYVTGDLYVATTRDLGNRIKTGKEIYRIKAGRRTDIPFADNFSITKIQCPSCGGSFDAFRSKICPFCGSEYKQENNDWVIYEIRNVKSAVMTRRVITGLIIAGIVVLSMLSLWLRMRSFL